MAGGIVDSDVVARAIHTAKEAEAMVTEYKAETYLGVLIAALLIPSPTIKDTLAKVINAPRAVKPKTIGELLAEKRPRTDVDRVLMAGYFLEQFEGQARFNGDDLVRCFERAKERIPGNINDAVNKNIRKGTMMEAAEKKDGKKAWLLTTTGEAVADGGFGS